MGAFKREIFFQYIKSALFGLVLTHRYRKDCKHIMSSKDLCIVMRMLR